MHKPTSPGGQDLDYEADLCTWIMPAMTRRCKVALSQLLRCEPPARDEHQIPCPCGHKARYREMRSRNALTVLGRAELLRA